MAGSQSIDILYCCTYALATPLCDAMTQKRMAQAAADCRLQLGQRSTVDKWTPRGWTKATVVTNIFYSSIKMKGNDVRILNDRQRQGKQRSAVKMEIENKNKRNRKEKQQLVGIVAIAVVGLLFV